MAKYRSYKRITSDDLVEYGVGDIVSVLLTDMSVMTGRINIIHDTGIGIDCSRNYHSENCFIDFERVKLINLYFENDDSKGS